MMVTQRTVLHNHATKFSIWDFSKCEKVFFNYNHWVTFIKARVPLLGMCSDRVLLPCVYLKMFNNTTH